MAQKKIKTVSFDQGQFHNLSPINIKSKNSLNPSPIRVQKALQKYKLGSSKEILEEDEDHLNLSSQLSLENNKNNNNNKLFITIPEKKLDNQTSIKNNQVSPDELYQEYNHELTKEQIKDLIISTNKSDKTNRKSLLMSSKNNNTIKEVQNNILLRIKKALSMVREMATGLVDEDLYLQLKIINESDLTINEFVLVKVYEMIQPYIKNYRLVKKRNSEIEETISEKNDKIEKLIDKVEKYEMNFLHKEKEFIQEIDNLKLECNVKSNKIDLIKKEMLIKENEMAILGNDNF